MKKISAVTAVLICAAVILSFSSALGNQGRSMSGAGIVQGLGLTADQQSKITAKEKEMEKDILPLKQSIQDLRSELNKELSSENPDKAKVNRLIESVSGKMTVIQQKKISYILWTREQLTAEQRQKLTTFLQKPEEGEAGEAKAPGSNK
ncbi:MAG: periplasmic heavy metal sensor [Candidatus Saganbacteria bacterium]|nr:periplasmic heavy metal sensor [Candidatus Saganbacteria bacterium]